MDPCLLIPFYSFCYHLISLSSVYLLLLCLHFFLDTPIIFSFTFFLSLSLFLWVFCALTTRMLERAEGASRGPELVTGSDDAKESSKDAIAMDLSTTYASTYGRSRDIT